MTPQLFIEEMDTSSIERYIYGTWRPWTANGPERLLQVYNETGDESDHDEDLSWWHGVVLANSFDRNSLAYRQMTEDHITTMHRQFLDTIEKADAKVDRQFVYVNYTRSLQGLLKDTASLQGQKEERLSAFVLQNLLRQLVNAVMDSALKYGDLTPGTIQEIDELYLTAINRPLPQPSPYYRRARWYEQEVRSMLQGFANGREGKQSVNLLVGSLADALTSADRGSERRHDLGKVQRHLENGLLLVRMEAPFLEDQPNRIGDAGFCAEWVEGLKQEIMNRATHDALVEDMRRLDELRRWLGNILRPLEEVAGDGSQSRACIWIQQMERLWNGKDQAGPWVEMRQNTNEESDMDGRKSFIDFFADHFVHMSELKQALGVSKRTVETYLDDADMEVRRLTLKANVWFWREDLEAFLEEGIE